MSRSIQNGNIALTPPIVEVVQTFDSNFGESNWRKRFARQGFAFLYRAEGGVADPARGHYPVELQDADGNWQQGRAYPNNPPQMRSINGEDQYYMRDYEYDLVEPPIPKLYEVENGSLKLTAIPTPDRFKDNALDSGVSSYKVLGFSISNRTIDVEGLQWERFMEPSDDGESYMFDDRPLEFEDDGVTREKQFRPHFIGFNRFNRDELDGEKTYWVTGDGSGEGGFKRRTYPYGWLLLQLRTGDRLVKYERVEDNITGVGGVPAGQDPSIKYTSSGRKVDSADQWKTVHRIKLVSGEMPTREEMEFIKGNQKVKPMRRFPWLASMFTTQGTFSQHYGVWEFSGRLANHKRQFFSWFLWGHYQKPGNWRDTNGDIYLAEYSLGSREPEDGSEIDGIEAPGGSTRRFHNVHAGNNSATARFGSQGMKNRAAIEGRGPVVSNPEWTETRKQQHQITNDARDPNYVVYTDDCKIRVYWWPQTNKYGKPGNSIEWYLYCPDGQWRRIGGAISPVWTGTRSDGVPEAYAAKQIYINHAVWGDFCRGLDLQYARGSKNPIDTDQIVSYVHYVKAYQFEGHRAGGAGFPDRRGIYSRGQFATPGDTTGGSGIGIVPKSAVGFLQLDGSVDGGSPPNQQENPGGVGAPPGGGTTAPPPSSGGPSSNSTTSSTGSEGRTITVSEFGPETFAGSSRNAPAGTQIRLTFDTGDDSTTSTLSGGGWSKSTSKGARARTVTITMDGSDAVVGPLTVGQTPSGGSGEETPTSPPTSGAGDGSQIFVDTFGPTIAGRTSGLAGETINIRISPATVDFSTPVQADGRFSVLIGDSYDGQQFIAQVFGRTARTPTYNIGASPEPETGGGSVGGSGGIIPPGDVDPLSTRFEDNVRVALDVESLVTAYPGSRQALRARITANLKGHGVAISFGTDGSVPGMRLLGNVLAFEQEIPARLYRNAIFVRARETGPPGTSPIIGAVSADGALLTAGGLSALQAPPTDQGSTPDGGSTGKPDDTPIDNSGGTGTNPGTGDYVLPVVQDNARNRAAGIFSVLANLEMRWSAQFAGMESFPTDKFQIQQMKRDVNDSDYAWKQKTAGTSEFRRAPRDTDHPVDTRGRRWAGFYSVDEVGVDKVITFNDKGMVLKAYQSNIPDPMNDPTIIPAGQSAPAHPYRDFRKPLVDLPGNPDSDLVDYTMKMFVPWLETFAETDFGRVNGNYDKVPSPSSPRQELRYGYTEAEIDCTEMDARAGVRITVWYQPSVDPNTPDTLVPAYVYDGVPENGVEIDVPELQPAANDQNGNPYGPGDPKSPDNLVLIKSLNTLGDPKTEGRNKPVPLTTLNLPNLLEGKHVFGMLWEPEKITFFVDGLITNVEPTWVPKVAMYLIISREINSGIRDSRGPSHIDGYRGYDSGIWGTVANPRAFPADKVTIPYVRWWQDKRRDGVYRDDGGVSDPDANWLSPRARGNIDPRTPRQNGSGTGAPGTGGSTGNTSPTTVTAENGDQHTMTSFGPLFEGAVTGDAAGLQVVFTYENGETDTTLIAADGGYSFTTRKSVINETRFFVTVESSPDLRLGPLRFGRSPVSAPPPDNGGGSTPPPTGTGNGSNNDRATGSNGETLTVTLATEGLIEGRTQGMPTGRQVVIEFFPSEETSSTSTDAEGRFAKSTSKAEGQTSITVTVDGSDAVVGPLSLSAGEAPAPNNNPDDSPRDEESGEKSVSLVNKGPIVVGQTVNVSEGVEGMIQLRGDSGFRTAKVDEDGAITFADIPSDHHGYRLRIFIPDTSTSDGAAAGGYFTFDKD